MTCDGPTSHSSASSTPDMAIDLQPKKITQTDRFFRFPETWVAERGEQPKGNLTSFFEHTEGESSICTEREREIKPYELCVCECVCVGDSSDKN